jgi:ABC-2 type transport system permease protein
VNALRLILTFARIGALNELAYRANFWLQAFESSVNLAMVLGAVAIVFRQTDSLGGWRADELVALVGVYYLVYGAIHLVVAPSLERFMQDVRQGTLDYTLTKPEDAQLLVSISEFRVWRLVDVALGAGVLGFALVRLSASVGPARALAFATALAAGSAIVYSFWIVLATCSFWFIRVENIMMIFWSMYTAGRWPVGIYPPWLRWTLTLLVPVAFAVTVPAEAISGRLEPATLAGAVALAAALLVVSRAFWKLGLRHYSGASA